MVTLKDLTQIDSIIERVEKLPTNADLKMKLLRGSTNQEDIKEYSKLQEELNDISFELHSFIKVKFPDNGDYFNQYSRINFEVEILGIPLRTNSEKENQLAWNDGINRLKGLLQCIRSETSLRLDDYDNNTQFNVMKNVLGAHTHISNSQVFVGDVTGSHIMNGDQSYVQQIKPENEQNQPNRSKDAPTKKLQILAIILAVIIGMSGLVLGYLYYAKLI
ncbi:MAG TPA: hypothetical protein VFG10_17845 [Saprospiraceae bacterium]|nr:hypothetical protein [Saprospiraceae bacterium]